MEHKGDSMTRRSCFLGSRLLGSYFLAVVALLLMASTAFGSSAAQPTTTVSAQDRAWLAEAHRANLAEVQVGKLAEKKGGTPAVRSVGAVLVVDHTQFHIQVTRLAHDLGVRLPQTAIPLHI